MLQMWVLKVGSVPYFSFLKDFRWFAYLFLKGGADRPTYFSILCVFSVVISVTVAWYIKFSERHLASRGHGVFFGQLQDLGCGLSVYWDSIFLLCPLIIFCILGVVL